MGVNRTEVIGVVTTLDNAWWLPVHYTTIKLHVQLDLSSSDENCHPSQQFDIWFIQNQSDDFYSLQTKLYPLASYTTAYGDVCMPHFFVSQCHHYSGLDLGSHSQ